VFNSDRTPRGCDTEELFCVNSEMKLINSLADGCTALCLPVCQTSAVCLKTAVRVWVTSHAGITTRLWDDVTSLSMADVMETTIDSTRNSNVAERAMLSRHKAC